MNPIAVLIYLALVAMTATGAAMAVRATRKKVMGNIRAMSAWAEARGWRVAEGDDPEVFALADEISTLLAEQGRRGVGVVVIGPSRGGRVIVIEGWLDDAQTKTGELGPSVDVAFDSTTLAASPTLLEVEYGGRVRALEGEAAPTPPQTQALAGLRPRSRLRVMQRRLLLRTPGYLTGKLVDELLARLARLEAAQEPPGRAPSM